MVDYFFSSNFFSAFSFFNKSFRRLDERYPQSKIKVMSFLKINNLSVNYIMRKETVFAAQNVKFDVSKGEILGLVGESGSGKSTVGNAIINLIDEPGKISEGSIFIDNIDIYKDRKTIKTLRGKKIGIIFQDPQTSLNPLLTEIGRAHV